MGKWEGTKTNEPLGRGRSGPKYLDCACRSPTSAAPSLRNLRPLLRASGTTTGWGGVGI